MAATYNLSYRTINNDIISINNFLDANRLSKLNIDANKVSSANLDIDQIYKVVCYQNYTLSKEERIISEAFILFFNTNPITIEDMANIMYLSRSTVLADIKDLSEYLDTHDINLIITPGKGMELKENSLEIVKLFLKLITSNLHLLNIFIISYLTDLTISDQNFEDFNLSIINMIGELEAKRDIIIIENSRFRLRWYLILTLFRCDKSPNYMAATKDGTISADIVENLEKNFDIKLGHSEILHLKDFTKTLDYKENNFTSSDLVPSQILAKSIIEEVSNQTGIGFCEDYQLFESLSYHIERSESCIYSQPFEIEYRTHTTNYDFLQSAYPLVRKKIHDYYKRDISDFELNFIMLYFYISYERLIADEISSMRAAIVCNYGVGVSELIKMKLVSTFNVEYITTYSIYNLQSQNLDEIDIIFSTENLAIVGKEIIKINPNMDENFLLAIKKRLRNLAHIRLIRLNLSKHNIENLTDNLSPRLTNLKGIDSYLTEDFITIVDEFNTWDKLIDIASKILLDKGFIKPSYAKKVISNLDAAERNIIIADNLALPHAAITDGVIKTGFSLVIIKNNSCSYQDKEIHFVCMLSAGNNEEHVRALFELANIFSDDEFRSRMLLSRSSIDAAKLIKSYLEK